MLEGRALILATKPYAKEIRSKSWIHTFSTLGLMAVSFAGAYFPFHPLVRLVFSMLSGLLLVRFFIIYHDYLHHSILRDSKLADFIFTVFGLYILAPKSIWKRSHDYHHNHNSKLYSSSIGSFPVVTKEKFLNSSKKDRMIYLFIRHPLTIAFGYLFSFTFGMCILSLARNPSKHWDSALSLIFHFGIGISVLYFFGWLPFLFGFLLPSVISSAIGSYLFYAQHNFPGVYFADQDGWTYIDAALNSSSYMKMHPIMHFFTGNIGYHHIHHTNARIPFYRLPEVYHAFPEFQRAKTTSLKPWDIAACFKLKVWDPEKAQMISSSDLKKAKHLSGSLA